MIVCFGLLMIEIIKDLAQDVIFLYGDTSYFRGNLNPTNSYNTTNAQNLAQNSPKLPKTTHQRQRSAPPRSVGTIFIIVPTTLIRYRQLCARHRNPQPPTTNEIRNDAHESFCAQHYYLGVLRRKQVPGAINNNPRPTSPAQ